MYNDCDIKTAMSQPVTNTGLIQEDLYEVRSYMGLIKRQPVFRFYNLIFMYEISIA